MNTAGASCNLLSTNYLPKLLQFEAARRSANYHPSVWGNYFLINQPKWETTETAMEERHKELKEEVRKMLVAAAKDGFYQLNFIDQIQRLGISYHFEDEIDAALEDAFETYNSPGRNDGHLDLHTTALHFRLFRQQGHNMSSDVFKSFLDDQGKFKESLTTDLHGLLSLYEASHMRMHGEAILDEALEFSSNHLNSMISNLTNTQAAQVADALKQPLRKRLARLEARRYISVYSEHDSRNKILSDFAKIDFNLVQKLHQRELRDLTRWWRDLNVAEKLPFARDRLVECFFWILGVYFEPKYCLARKFLTKVISMTSILDDIYDVYGTLDELVLLTDAIERWDMNALDQLPEYMRGFYRALLDVYCEMDQELAIKGRSSYGVDYAKSAMKRQAKAYFEEAKWYHDGYVPTMSEYMEVALLTAGYLMLVTTSFVGMEEIYASKAAFKWISEFPLAVRASSVINRLTDDMVGHEFEERGLVSAVECYMKEHEIPKAKVYAILEEQILNAWKDIIQEFIRPTAVPMPLLTLILNFARVIDTLYKDEDGYRHSSTKTKALVSSVLIDPVPT